MYYFHRRVKFVIERTFKKTGHKSVIKIFDLITQFKCFLDLKHFNVVWIKIESYYLIILKIRESFDEL